ncbi:MAG: hypothetical protein ACXWQO_09965 [Bdellovibrionota bacterium]
MKILAALLLFAPGLAFAHGSLAQQSSEAVKQATELFVRTQSPDLRRQFSSLTATLAGHEQFNVEISLKDRTLFKYDCHENESVNPIIWECKAL